MKRLIINIIVICTFFLGGQSCIDDDSVGITRELSLITIESAQDTIYADFGVEDTIPAIVKQTGAGEMSFEWGLGNIDADGNVVDSLRVISTEPELHYTFNKLGQFKLRLKVTNSDGSSYYYFVLYVASGFQEGLLVLSKDENNLGRTSFLKVKNPDEIITGTGNFIPHALEAVNPEIVLNDVKDMSWFTYLMVLTEGGKTIHMYDKQSFDYVTDFKGESESGCDRMKKFCEPNPPQGMMGQAFLWGENGELYVIDHELETILPADDFAPGERFDKAYVVDDNGHLFFVNYDESYVVNFLGGIWPSPRYSDEGHFAGRYIVNLMTDNKQKLMVVTTDLEDPQDVMITTFAANSFSFFDWTFTGGLTQPGDYSYYALRPITLTRDAQMLVNRIYMVGFYNRGNELYKWIYTGPELPEEPIVTFDGEITCMSLSPDKEYLYIGVWDILAKEELKGSIYIWEMKSNKIVREYRGVADKPIKIMYKNSDI